VLYLKRTSTLSEKVKLTPSTITQEELDNLQEHPLSLRDIIVDELLLKTPL
ncbi:hypothetical protein S245_021300, partial [Arachis hypogaea]